MPAHFLGTTTPLDGGIARCNCCSLQLNRSRGQLKCDGTRAENRFRLSRGTDESI